jgi:hypothetical protein
VAYGLRADAAFEPGGDGRGEVADRALGEEQAGVLVVEGRQEGGRCAVAVQVR